MRRPPIPIAMTVLDVGRPSTQETPMTESKRRGVLDMPPELVIGLAEGETRWRGMTVLASRPDTIFPDNHPDLSPVATVSPDGIFPCLPRPSRQARKTAGNEKRQRRTI